MGQDAQTGEYDVGLYSSMPCSLTFMPSHQTKWYLKSQPIYERQPVRPTPTYPNAFQDIHSQSHSQTKHAESN